MSIHVEMVEFACKENWIGHENQDPDPNKVSSDPQHWREPSAPLNHSGRSHLLPDDLVELVLHLVHRPVRVHRHPRIVTQPLVIPPHLKHTNGCRQKFPTRYHQGFGYGFVFAELLDPDPNFIYGTRTGCKYTKWL